MTDTKSDKIPESAKKVFKGEIFDVYQWDQKMYDGSTQVFEGLKRPNTAVVIAVVGDKIILLEQSQPHKTNSFASLPGGRCEKDETPLESAKRELLEETGYESDDWELLHETQPVGKIDWTVYTFVARNCKYIQPQNLDVGEKISMKMISFDEFLALQDDLSFSEKKELVRWMSKMRYDDAEKEKLHNKLFK